MKVVALLALVAILVSCLFVGKDSQESFEHVMQTDAFKSETSNFEMMRARGYSGLVSDCSLEGALALEALSEPDHQMRMAVAVISAPNQLNRRQV